MCLKIFLSFKILLTFWLFQSGFRFLYNHKLYCDCSGFKLMRCFSFVGSEHGIWYHWPLYSSLMSYVRYLGHCTGLAFYLVNRTFFVHFPHHLLYYCVAYPRDQFWDLYYSPFIYFLFGYILQEIYFDYLCYANDSQLYLPVRPGTTFSFNFLFRCINYSESWMVNIFWQLNEDKTTLWF